MPVFINEWQNPMVVPDVTPYGAGVMTPAMLATLNKIGTQQLIYVSTTGSDSNPGTVDLPLATPRAAWTLAAASWWTTRSQIIFSPGSYVLDGSNGFSYANAAGAKNGGSPIVLAGGYEDAGQGIRTVTANSANGTIFTDGTLALTTNQYVGYVIKCITGANAGRQTLVRSNTATALTLQIKFPNAISINDTFEILQPSVTFTVAANTSAIFGHNNDYIGMIGIKFSMAASSSTLIFVDYTHVGAEGVQIAGGGGTVIINTLAVVQDPTTGPWAGDTVNPFSGLRTSGISFSNCTIRVGNQAMLSGAHVFQTTNLNCIFPEARVELANPIGFSAGFTLSNNSYLQVFDRNGGALPGALSLVGTAATSPVRLQTGSRGDITQLDLTDMGAVPCISVDDNSSATCAVVTGTTGNTDVGLQATNMARIKQTSCTVTGTAGDTRTNTTITAYGALPFTDTDTLTRIQ